MEKAHAVRNGNAGAPERSCNSQADIPRDLVDTPLRAALLRNRGVIASNMRARTILTELVKDRILNEATAEEIRKIGKGTNKEMNEAIIAELYSRDDLDIVRLCRIIQRNGQDFLADLVQENVTSELIGFWDPASRKLGNHWKRLAVELKTHDSIPKIMSRYPNDVRAQALFWLIEWEKKDAANANVKTLVETLQHCGMKKAAAFLKKLNRTQSRSKRRKKTKSTGARRKASPSPSVKRSRAPLAVPTQAGNFSNSSNLSSKPKKRVKGGRRQKKKNEKPEEHTVIEDEEDSQKRVRFEEDLVKRSLGEMRIHVSVEAVELSPIPRQPEEEVITVFLKKLLEDKQLSAPTRYAIEGINPYLSVDDVIKLRDGSVTFIVNCRTLTAVDALWDRYGEGERLLKLMQKTLVTEPLLKQIDARGLIIKISMNEEEFHVCREELLAAAAAGLNIPMSYSGPKKEVMERLKKQFDKHKVQYREAIEEYNKFELNMTNFVSALKRIKPPSVQKVSSVFMVEKYFEICTSKTSNMKRAIGTYLNVIDVLRQLHSNAKENVLETMLKIRPEVETDTQRKCRDKVKSQLGEWEKLLDHQCDISQIEIHHTAKEYTPTPDLLALRPVLSLLPTVLEIAGKFDRRIDMYIKEDESNSKV
ncbi:uncharacterized protein [Ptychodera flava]|uniref:uncharacterized protein isoform X2 n=1 Tax=Ptychodera flava TaxID=63121 RepID=UPI00396A5915